MGSSTIPSGSGGGLQPKYQKFVTSGTFTLPDGYGVAKPLLVNIQVIGGGGGGAGNQTYVFNGNGGHRDYFGEGYIVSGTYNTSTDSAGGSGGLCATQLYLTSNLTITVGAAGTKGVTGSTVTNNENPYGGNFGNTGNNFNITIASGGATAGGTGGTSTASVLQATGGAGGSLSGNISGGRFSSIRNGFGNYNVGQWQVDNRGKGAGGGGTPAGTTGQTTPLLGTLAGGSYSTTPIRGSFGVGGISTDGNVSTGAEGTGGGDASIGASGAVILTWWQ